MTTDNKTLADVQPGGRVRLGDRLPEAVARALATVNEAANDARHAGNYKVANALVTARVTLSKQLRALSAQPSPGGQGDARIPFETWAKDGGFDVSKFKGIYNSLETRAAWEAWLYWQRLAARQPVYVQGCDELRARTEGERAAYMEGLEEGKKIAARQPVGEPVGEVFWDNETGEISVNWLNGDLPPGIGTLLYDTQPAQAVDLGQFRDVVADWRDRCCRAADKNTIVNMAKADRLLALIDSQAVGNG